jgi:hypothetical protein
MTPPALHLLLEELIEADFGVADLKAMRSQLPVATDDAFPAAGAKSMLDALASAQRRTAEQVYVWAGTRVAAPVTKLLPSVFRAHTSTRTVILQLSSLAAAVVTELLPDATCPDFWEDFLDGETVRIGFDGPTEVAWLMEGLVRGLGTHFGERVEVGRPATPPALKDRRLLDVKVSPERRSRQVAGLSAASLRG